MSLLWDESPPSPTQLAYDAAYVVYTNHIMSCKNCYAPMARYCSTGMALLLEADALHLMAMGNADECKRLLRREYERRPQYAVALKNRVIELYNRELEAIALLEESA